LGRRNSPQFNARERKEKGVEKKPVKTPSQIEAEKAAAESLVQEIHSRINRIPPAVTNGDVRKAQSWKERAFKAMKLAQQSSPKERTSASERDRPKRGLAYLIFDVGEATN
jgi:hypothetical protein